MAEVRRCSNCIHRRVCYLHREMLQFIDAKIKPSPLIHMTVVELVSMLSKYCNIFVKGDPYA